MEIPLQGLGVRETYKLLIGSVLPRPIAWVSTQDQAGRVNLAPFSFFNAVSIDPPLLAFSNWTPWAAWLATGIRRYGINLSY